MPPPRQFELDAGWVVIGVIGVIGLFFSWLLLVIAVCAAVSRSRGPDHYTKFMVPYAYRFKWDMTWILLLLFGVPSWFMVYAWAHTNIELTGGWLLVAAITFFIALMRCVIWCCFRFPLTAWFFVMFIAALVMGGRLWL